MKFILDKSPQLHYKIKEKNMKLLQQNIQKHAYTCTHITVAALHQGAPGQMTWLEDPLPWLSPAYCFASVITENKNVTVGLTDRFICFILTAKQSAALAACVLRLKKVVNFFEEKSASGDHGLRIFWNDLAPLLPWRLHLMTCLTTLVAWKWPGCIDVLAPPPLTHTRTHTHISNLNDHKSNMLELNRMHFLHIYKQTYTYTIHNSKTPYYNKSLLAEIKIRKNCEDALLHNFLTKNNDSQIKHGCWKAYLRVMGFTVIAHWLS